MCSQRIAAAADKGSLVGVLSLCEHVGLQLGEVSLLVAALADPHVQQVGVYGCVVGLQQPALYGLSCTHKHTHTVTSPALM